MLVKLDRLSQQRVSGPSKVALFGSTGSIGKSTLEIIRANRDRFEVVALIAGRSIEELAAQCREFTPKYVGIGDPEAEQKFQSLLETGYRPEIVSGLENVAELAALSEVQLIVSAIVGFEALPSVLTGLCAGKIVALANKESIVAGGQFLAAALDAHPQAAIIPVDSEHSAILQLLKGERRSDLKRVILTASGGPFLHTPLTDLPRITPEQALAHPTWSMGNKISIDSATMVNKALELIEACWLYGLCAEEVDVVIHPQSIVHSLIELCDCTQLAQLSSPDMKGPIAYAMSASVGRMERIMKPLDLRQVGTLEFLPLDPARFPAIELARECWRLGAGACAAFNIANEIAVESFLNRGLPFSEIVPVVERAVARYGGCAIEEVTDLFELRREIRLEQGGTLIKKATPNGVTLDLERN